MCGALSVPQSLHAALTLLSRSFWYSRLRKLSSIDRSVASM